MEYKEEKLPVKDTLKNSSKELKMQVMKIVRTEDKYVRRINMLKD